TVVAQSFLGGGVRMVQSLGVSAGCNNSCDPYCNKFQDNPGGLDAAGLSQNDATGGFFIPPNAGSGGCTCNEPMTPSALYSNLISLNKGNPSSCSGNDAGTATDNCNHDYQCVSGTCQPYAIAGVNPTSTAAPDYTLGLGCHDGSSWELDLCNRGYVPTPSIGNLVIAIGSGSPS